MIGRTTWVDYINHDEYGLVARVGLRTQNNERKDCYFTDIEPWGFVYEDEELPEKDWIENVEHGYESIFDDPLKKVTTTIPKKVNDRRDSDVLTNYVSDHFEADIPMYRKLSMVDGISGYIEIPDEPEEEVFGIEVYSFDDVNVEPEYDGEITPRVMMADIEVRIGDESFEETREKATQPINVICSYDNYEGEYAVFFYDKYDNIENPTRIREIVEEQWDSEGDYTDASIEFRSSPSEESMLEDFIDYTIEKNFDLTSGWNWIDFDYNYIINRCKKLNDVEDSRLSPFGSVGYTSNDQMQIAGLPAFDMMRAFDKMTFKNFRSMSLDYVCREELGVGKVDDVDINEDWRNNPEKLIGYNIVDVMLTVALDGVNDIHGFFYEIASICSIPIYDAFYEKRQVDGYVISRRNDDEILPSTDESQLIENAGGYVAEPIQGRKEHVGVSDLKSLYPSAMITWNISTETISSNPSKFDNYVRVPKVPEPIDVEGEIQKEEIEMEWLYCSLDKEGLIPRTLKKLFKKRNREKEKMYSAENEAEESKWDRKQGATKVLMNSFYGVSSSKYWRLSNEYLGDAVTSTARYTLWKGRQTLRRIGYEHIYSDTDSHLFKLTEDTPEERVEELVEVSKEMDADASEIAEDIGIENAHPFLEDSELHGDNKTCMKWEPEAIFQRFLQLGNKKRYAGNLEWEL